MATALITGGSRRVGKAMALALATKGYNIALHYRSSAKEANTLAKQIRKLKVRCEVFPGSLSDLGQVKTLMSDARKQFKDLNVLINNASIFLKSRLNSQGVDFLDAHFNVHLKAPFLLSTEFAKYCKKGQIINIIDTNVVKNKTAHVAYLLSKKSLWELTKLAAVELAPKIRVNAIAPGLILPPEGESVAYLDKRAKSIPLKKRGNSNHVTSTLDFLLDNEFVTGQVIHVDGGEHLI